MRDEDRAVSIVVDVVALIGGVGKRGDGKEDKKEKGDVKRVVYNSWNSRFGNVKSQRWRRHLVHLVVAITYI